MLEMPFYFLGGLVIGVIIGGSIVWFLLRTSQDRYIEQKFKALASDVLTTSSDQLVKRSKEQVAAIVSPLQDSLQKLDEHIRNLEQKREGAYQGLQEQLRQLYDTHKELQNATKSLENALKSKTMRGKWGELQLRRVVELSGLVKHVDFSEQPATGEGRPDMIIHLPQGGIIPVDAKVPLDAYLQAIEANDEQQQKDKMSEHAKAFRNTIRELGQRKYWEQFEQSPDCVVMFVPNESFLTAAFEVDPSLYEYALQQRVLLATPTTLLALLKAIAYGWQQNQIMENARQVAQQGQEVYKRFSTFIKHMVNLSNSLEKAVDYYNKAIGSFEQRLLPAVRQLRSLGAGQEDFHLPKRIDTRAQSPSNLEDIE